MSHFRVWLLVLCSISILLMLYLSLHTSHPRRSLPPSILEPPSVMSCIPQTSAVVKSLSFPFDFNSPNVSLSRTQLLLLIISAPNETERRSAIRVTWGSSHRLAAAKAARVFVVGESPHKDIRERMKYEREMFGDILTDSVLTDSYRNLTRKVVSSLFWAVTQPWSQLRYVAKIDSDCFVNVARLREVAEQISQNCTEPWITGCAWSGIYAIRDPSNKWYVSKREYPFTKYPPYANGPSYMLSLTAVQRIINFETLRDVTTERAMRLEDIYITGILRERLNIKLIQRAKFFHHWSPKTLNEKVIAWLASLRLASIHGVLKMPDYVTLLGTIDKGKEKT